MKTIINTNSSIFLAILFLVQASFGQQTERDDHIINFSTFNHNVEIEKGIWFATIEKEKVCVQLMDSKNRSNPSFLISLCIPANEFTMTNDDEFELIKPSGTIKFLASFPDDKGNGDFIFTKNEDFAAFLKKESISSNGDGRNEYFKLYLGDISKQYVLTLKKLGYQPTLRQLGKLGIHDVDLDYINSIDSTNYKGLDLNMLIKFAIHDISINYINDLEKAGYGNIDANMVKKFAVHDISVDYINDLSEAGYSNLDPNMIKNFAVHDITIGYIKDLSTVGFANLDPNMLKQFAVHDISPKYIQSLQDAGIKDTDPQSFKKAKIHGLTASYIKRAQAKGHNSNELSDYIKLKIHGK